MCLPAWALHAPARGMQNICCLQRLGGLDTCSIMIMLLMVCVCVCMCWRVRFGVAVTVLNATDVHDHFGSKKIAIVLFCIWGAFW